MKSQFYITLPSNSSMQYFPENKTCCYITQLPRTIDLHGEWEVAIVEIQYPLTYLPDKKARPTRQITEDGYSVNTAGSGLSNNIDRGVNAAMNRLANGGGIFESDDTPMIFLPEKAVKEVQRVPSLMFVYCDIIEPRIVGDVYAPLLRILQARRSSDNEGTEVKTFSPPHYLPLLLSSFRTIEISIRDHQGKSIPFDHGTLTVTLHFKKVY